MALFGIYASHTTESCPLNNINTAKGLLQLTASNVDSLTKNTKSTQFLANTIQRSNTHLSGSLMPKTLI